MEPGSEIPLLRDIHSHSHGHSRQQPPAAVTLPRGDARERPLFTRAEVAELLAIPVTAVLKLAAAYNIGWVQTSTGTGPQFSAKAVKQMIRASLATGATTTPRATANANEPDPTLSRFDRAALTWFMLEGQPTRAATIPAYRQRFEQELARVAKLAEPARSIRIAELQSAWKDAKGIAGTLRRLDV